MDYGFHDFAGSVGVALILWTYLALQLGKLEQDQLLFSVLNALGAAGVLISLAVDFNPSAVVIEAFWLLISLFGIVRWWRTRRAPALAHR